MKQFNNGGMWLRMVGIMAIIGVLTTGVTYAALQSQQSILAANTIESATAALQLSKDGANYSNNASGFNFPNLVPGGPAMPSQTNGYSLWLKNSGSAPLSANLSIINPPTTTGGVDLSKVSIILSPVNLNGTLGTPQTVPIASLIASSTSNGVSLNIPAMTPGVTMQYKIQVQMMADAFTGASASITNLDLVFGGTATVQ